MVLKWGSYCKGDVWIMRVDRIAGVKEWAGRSFTHMELGLLRSLVTFSLFWQHTPLPQLQRHLPSWLSSISPSFCLLRNPSLKLWQLRGSLKKITSILGKASQELPHPPTHTLISPPARIDIDQFFLPFTCQWGSYSNILIQRQFSLPLAFLEQLKRSASLHRTSSGGSTS